MPFDPTLRDRLCELESENPLLRERYEKELQDMFERKLSPLMKVFVSLVSVASVGIAIFLGGCAMVYDKLPIVARAGLAGGVLFALAWAGLGVWALRRGSMSLKFHPAAMAAILWVFAVLMETCFLAVAPTFPDHFYAILSLFCGLVILIGAGVMMVCTSVQQAALRIQESLLRLEYRLADRSGPERAK
jgi:hypothetical protein